MYLNILIEKIKKKKQFCVIYKIVVLKLEKVKYKTIMEQ